jgi:hypothetical protein
MNKLKTLGLRPLFLLVLTLIYSGIFSQGINQDINTITVKGVGFRQVVDGLLKRGYSIEKTDRSKIVKTRYSKIDAKNDLLNLSITVRVWDSVAVITGRICYNLKNLRKAVPDSTHSWEAKYTFGPDKQAFLLLDDFAKSFGSEIIYSKTQ